jgi:hypothetical protein
VDQVALTSQILATTSMTVLHCSVVVLAVISAAGVKVDRWEFYSGSHALKKSLALILR